MRQFPEFQLPSPEDKAAILSLVEQYGQRCFIAGVEKGLMPARSMMNWLTSKPPHSPARLRECLLEEMNRATGRAETMGKDWPVMEDDQPDRPGWPDRPQKLSEVVACVEREHILLALRDAGGNRKAAARLLGVSRKNVWEKMRKLGIKAERGSVPFRLGSG